jgi:Leucine-rich repeat (LRR) protein
VADISPLLPLVNLVELSLWQNQVTDISALSPLVNLVVLNLGENQVGDISALESLTNLRILNLNENRITDIAPLVRNPGLSEGDWVHVRGNPLNADSVSQYLPELKSRNVNW